MESTPPQRRSSSYSLSVHLALSAYPPLQGKEVRRAGGNPLPRTLSPFTEAPLQWFTRPLLRPPSLMFRGVGHSFLSVKQGEWEFPTCTSTLSYENV